MLFTTSLFLTVLPLAALAGNQHLASARHQHRNVAQHIQCRSNKKYTLTDKYAGQSFFDGWDFFSGDDPTHGNVDYLSSDEAFKSGLAFVQDDGTVVMAVDDKTWLPAGANRKSVRIQSKKSYNGGLFIADISAMPHGCSVWPAWWMAGPNWPNGGEIDILEGVHDQPTNQYTLHTSQGCNLDPTPDAVRTRNATSGALQAFSSKVLGTKCASSGADNSGCAFLDTDTRSYGKSFNAVNGGVFATLWDATGISVWHFARSEVPADVGQGKPNPAGWGVPNAFWSAATCNTAAHFHDHQLIFDITLCGDWAGATYQSAGCPGTCASAVANPANFQNAKWNINYVAVYN